jgi:hypothetical protein
MSAMRIQFRLLLQLVSLECGALRIDLTQSNRMRLHSCRIVSLYGNLFFFKIQVGSSVRIEGRSNALQDV